jgi:hypothetical protein
MPRRDHGDDDNLPVMVPRNDKTMVAVSPERVRRLREHLLKELAYLHPDGSFVQWPDDC